MSIEHKKIEEKAIEIIQDNDRCDVRNNMYSPDLKTSMKVSWLLELARKEKKDLIIEHCGVIHIGTSDKFSYGKSDEFTSRIIVDLGLSKATQDLSDDMLQQLEDKYGPVQYELCQYFIEGINFQEVSDDSIVIKINCGT